MERKKQRQQRQLNRTHVKKSPKKVKTTVKKSSPQISIFTVLLIIMLIAACVGVYFGARYLVITLMYKEYTDKMYEYGYNELYINKKATATEKVTNAEMIRVVLGTLKNTKNIENIYHLASVDNSDLHNWYNYSKDIGIGPDDLELDKQATVIDAVMLATKIIDGIKEDEIKSTTLKMSVSKLKEYSKEEQKIIAKAVTLGVIKNKDSVLSGKEILKGELNKLLISLAETYATMHYNKADEDIDIVTKKEDMPTNYKEYPYIVNNISKDTYEQELKVQYTPNFKTPKEVYKTMGYLYSQTDYMLTSYFNTILNIDYETITTKIFLDKIAKEVVYEIDESDVEEYVQYVKDNKIKIKGEATPLLPIMYNTGETLVVRTKITFKVLNSDTEYNLLFGDEEQKIKYVGNEITMYVDVPVGGTFNSKSLLVYINCMAMNLSKPTTAVVIEE